MFVCMQTIMTMPRCAPVQLARLASMSHFPSACLLSGLDQKSDYKIYHISEHIAYTLHLSVYNSAEIYELLFMAIFQAFHKVQHLGSQNFDSGGARSIGDQNLQS